MGKVEDDVRYGTGWIGGKNNEEKYKWWQARRAIYRRRVGGGMARQGRDGDGMASSCPEGKSGEGDVVEWEDVKSAETSRGAEQGGVRSGPAVRQSQSQRGLVRRQGQGPGRVGRTSKEKGRGCRRGANRREEERCRCSVVMEEGEGG